MEHLKEKLQELDTAEKIEFAKAIMPEMCRLMEDNPRLMQEMMSSCMKMMEQEGMNIDKMMQMMGNF